MKDKFLVSIEFRYSDAPKWEGDFTSKSQKVTIGVYDDFDTACKHGNELLEKLEKRFSMHKFPGGVVAPKDRFSKNGGAFGSKKTLITNLAYLKTPFEFYAKIDTLKFDDIDVTVTEVVAANKRYQEHRKLDI